ncbi:MAG TPA: type II toxin-antitoxin system VapC family toxin [Thermoanaerobaculia bacterium]|nr:type II toxin-antitoxin system VapC family toxin [Thermoanaerobaculia bacterium]
MPDDGLDVLDSCAVIAFLQREPGAEVLAEILKNPRNRCLIHTLNVCEVYYDIYRRDGEKDASALEEILVTTGIELVETVPSLLWRTAGKLKAEWRRVSLADCFALALALSENGTVLSTDHHELDRIAEAAIYPIRFIR